MKRILLFLEVTLLIVCLCACSSSESTNYSVTRNETEFIIDTENNTISDGVHTYQYSFQSTISGYDAKIIYPNDSSWYWHQEYDGNGYGSCSDNYDDNQFIAGDALYDMLIKEAPQQKHQKNILLIIFLLAVGLFYSSKPYTAWYLAYGWIYKDCKPSDIALGLYRTVGIIFIIIAVIMILI